MKNSQNDSCLPAIICIGNVMSDNLLHFVTTVGTHGRFRKTQCAGSHSFRANGFFRDTGSEFDYRRVQWQNRWLSLLKEAEHRPMILQNFPNWLKRVEFWHIHDLDCCGPDEAFTHLDREVAALVSRLDKAIREPSI